MVRKPTELIRATCTQELRTLLDAELNAAEGSYRLVTIMTPPEPAIHVSVDHPTPLEAGPDRNYRTPRLPPDSTITFHLQPQQVLYGQSEAGLGFASILCEYLED